MKVFVSYSHTDAEVAMTLVRELSPYCEVWIDSDDIRAGTNWQQSINDAIACCDLFLFLASWTSLDSPYCQDEVDLALRKRKKIIPLVLNNPIVMRPELAQLQWIFLENDDWFRSLLLSLQPEARPWRTLALAEMLVIVMLTAMLVAEGSM